MMRNLNFLWCKTFQDNRAPNASLLTNYPFMDIYEQPYDTPYILNPIFFCCLPIISPDILCGARIGSVSCSLPRPVTSTMAHQPRRSSVLEKQMATSRRQDKVSEQCHLHFTSLLRGHTSSGVRSRYRTRKQYKTTPPFSWKQYWKTYDIKCTHFYCNTLLDPVQFHIRQILRARGM